jgi:hypothetical protein
VSRRKQQLSSWFADPTCPPRDRLTPGPHILEARRLFLAEVELENIAGEMDLRDDDLETPLLEAEWIREHGRLL